MKNLQASIFVLLLLFTPLFSQEDPLPSWNEGPAKEAIFEFVRKANDLSSRTYIPLKDRIATFDLDGTLIVEKPNNPWRFFTLDRVKSLAPDHPEWKNQEPFEAILAGDDEKINRLSGKEWLEIINATHTGISTEAYSNSVKEWLANARHPRFDRLFTSLAYQPMLEVIAYLRSNGFKTYIMTGSTQEFLRVFSQSVYGIPPEQAYGSSFANGFEYRNEKPILMMLPKLFFEDNFAGKAIGINLFIGKHPAIAFGNSDGDQEMLEWTQAGGCNRLMMLVSHDDRGREYDYPKSDPNALSPAVKNEAEKKGWIIISMKRDWKRIFSFEEEQACKP